MATFLPSITKPMSPFSSEAHYPDATSHKFYPSLEKSRPKKMSVTQTYYLAHTARRKLTQQAARADHDLRLLVGHANLLDSLMVDLAEAEEEQECWFNQTVNGATTISRDRTESRRVQWVETMVEDSDDSDSEDVSDIESLSSDESDYDEEHFIIQTPQPAYRRREVSPVAIVRELEEIYKNDQEEDDDDDDDDSDFEYEELERLTLSRSPSRIPQSPPELSLDSDEESEDDSMPPSPEQPTLDSFPPNGPLAVFFDNSKVSAVLPIAQPGPTHMFSQEYYSSHPGERTTIEAC